MPTQLHGRWYDWVAAGLWVAVPVAFVVVFFQVCAWRGFWPVPAERLDGATWAGMLVPTAATGLGVYHVPLVAAVVGLVIHALARRWGPGLVVLAALILAIALDPAVSNVSPIAWMGIPMLYAAVLAGVGVQSLAWAGPADAGVLATAMGASIALACATGLLGRRFAPAGMYFEAAYAYGLAAVAVAAVFFITRSGARWHLFRWLILATAVGFDVLVGARMILARMR